MRLLYVIRNYQKYLKISSQPEPSLGGTVKKGNFGEEIGVYTIKTVNDLKFMGDEIKVFQWHGNTFTLPSNATLLAYNEKYFQAFKVKKALGL